MDEETRQYLAEQRANEQKNWEGKRPAQTHIESTAETALALHHQKYNSDKQRENSNRQLEVLERIEANTAATHFWSRVVGVPVLVSIIFWIVAILVQACS